MQNDCAIHDTPLEDCQKFPLAAIASGCKPARIPVKREGFSSDCTERYGNCSMYAHRHCAGCDKVLDGEGGGGDDGRGVAGYDDAHPCATCPDSLLCSECQKQSPLCPYCENEAFVANCDPATCPECRVGAA